VQLETPGSTPALRERLSTAALALLLLPTAAAAADSIPTNQLDYTGLFYGEQGRVDVFEPIVRAMRLFPDGQSLSAQLGIDVITGASPSGALPSGAVQTTTTASGHVRTVAAGQLPLTKFQDHRAALDGEWKKPLGRFFTSTLGVHASREKDYQSLGVNGKLSVDLMQRLVTVTAGGGVNDDSVFPTGGTPVGLSDGSVLAKGASSKRVTTLLLGVSRIVTRRWMVALDGNRTYESGYLTEPYKLLSLMDPVTGDPVGLLTDKRPSTHSRSSLLASSVYHLTNDVLYTSYRYYWDSWNVRSNTIELKYRHDRDNDWYVEPHVRFYRQTAASFFTIGLVDGAPLPEFATSDYRLGPLTTITIGSTVGFHIGDSSHPWTLRLDYIRQAGNSSPPSAIGIQRSFDLAPAVNTVTAVVGYSFNF
jgi:Protein of unknown function (DUF3570)